jgi:SAM-dependent methyltransferase
VPWHPFGDRFRPRAFLRYVRYGVPTLFGKTVGDRYLLDYIANRPAIAAALEELSSQMPQAIVVDDTVHVAPGNWRMHFASRLSGAGIEIGALHRPLPAHAGMNVSYVDRADVSALKREFAPVAEGIVPVQIVDNAETLATIADASQDFVIAGHVIEHMRDPIGAIAHWLRVLRPDALLYLIVPDKRKTFDRARVRTTLEHLILDYREPSRERDFEHFLEYATFVHALHGDAALDEARKLAAEDYSIHFHTFMPADIVALLRWMDGALTPLEIVEGPVMTPEPRTGEEEFHVLVRRREAAR